MAQISMKLSALFADMERIFMLERAAGAREAKKRRGKRSGPNRRSPPAAQGGQGVHGRRRPRRQQRRQPEAAHSMSQRPCGGRVTGLSVLTLGVPRMAGEHMMRRYSSFARPPSRRTRDPTRCWRRLTPPTGPLSRLRATCRRSEMRSPRWKGCTASPRRIATRPRRSRRTAPNSAMPTHTGPRC